MNSLSSSFVPTFPPPNSTVAHPSPLPQPPSSSTFHVSSVRIDDKPQSVTTTTNSQTKIGQKSQHNRSDGSRSRPIFSGQFDPSKGVGTVNTSLIFFGNKLYALSESDILYALKFTPNGDIITVGRHDFDRKQADVPIFSMTCPSFLHDFAITKNYVVFPEIQIGMSPIGMIGSGSQEPGDPDGDEDDGYIVSYVHDENNGESRFLVMDAKSSTLEIVSIVKLPRRVPYGFHGLFVRESDINKI
ncbi:hypothetical protein L2E82_47899 [Cichorium intybus]|uniref:Uncharacterized protein n=1 Tax=Cichorium intybus TaxID=13427 RepID=A0ACB8YXU5_CICIN|nr:hypothetical protein L2E82_47899 [Cichorium intybus]